LTGGRYADILRVWGEERRGEGWQLAAGPEVNVNKVLDLTDAPRQHHLLDYQAAYKSFR
jgi:hypothetical protein